MADSGGEDAGSHRAVRFRRVKLAIITSVLIRPLAVITPFITVPLFLRYLGVERYGLYETIGALALWLGMTDAGLSQGLQNRLQDCHVRGDRELAQRYTSSLIIALFGLVIGCIVVFSIVAWAINWNHVFSTSDARAQAEVPWAVWFAGVLTLVGTVSTISVSGYTAYQEQHKANLWDGACRLATLAGSIAVVHTRFGLVGVLVVISGLSSLLRFASGVYLFGFAKPWLRPRWALFDWNLMRSTLADSINVFVLQMAVVAIFQSDRIIIEIVLGAEQVVPYAIGGRFFMMAYGLFLILLMPLWSAYGDAIRRGDLAWVRRGVRIAVMVGCGSILLCGVVLLVAGKWVFPFWTRDPSIHISANLIVAMTATFAFRAWVDSRTIVLNSVGVFRPQLVFWISHAVLNAVLAIAMAKPFGVVGVAWATPISAVCTSVWGYPWLMRRYLYANAAGDRMPALGNSNKLSKT